MLVQRLDLPGTGHIRHGMRRRRERHTHADGGPRSAEFGHGFADSGYLPNSYGHRHSGRCHTRCHSHADPNRNTDSLPHLHSLPDLHSLPHVHLLPDTHTGANIRTYSYAQGHTFTCPHCIPGSSSGAGTRTYSRTDGLYHSNAVSSPHATTNGYPNSNSGSDTVPTADAHAGPDCVPEPKPANAGTYATAHSNTGPGTTANVDAGPLTHFDAATHADSRHYWMQPGTG